MLFASRRVTTHADRNSTPDVVTTNLQNQCSKFKSLQKKKNVDLGWDLNPPHVFPVLHRLHFYL
jgi:hypothetical protein